MSKINEMFDGAVQWLVLSSSDPKKSSLALRGLLMLGMGKAVEATTFLCGFGLLCLNIDVPLAEQTIEMVSNIAEWLLLIVGGMMFVWGSVRKLWLTIIGKNIPNRR